MNALGCFFFFFFIKKNAARAENLLCFAHFQTFIFQAGLQWSSPARLIFPEKSIALQKNSAFIQPQNTLDLRFFAHCVCLFIFIGSSICCDERWRILVQVEDWGQYPLLPFVTSQQPNILKFVIHSLFQQCNNWRTGKHWRSVSTVVVLQMQSQSHTHLAATLLGTPCCTTLTRSVSTAPPVTSGCLKPAPCDLWPLLSTKQFRSTCPPLAGCFFAMLGTIV